jgi:hypothetical protein
MKQSGIFKCFSKKSMHLHKMKYAVYGKFLREKIIWCKIMPTCYLLFKLLAYYFK